MALISGFGRLLGKSSALRGIPVKQPSLGTRYIPAACFPSRGISTKLFVSGLSFYTTEKSFTEAFSRYGQLVEARIVMDRFAQRSKGYGFVQYATQDEADEAIKGMDGKFLDGRVIFVEVSKPKSELAGSSQQDANLPGLKRNEF